MFYIFDHSKLSQTQQKAKKRKQMQKNSSWLSHSKIDFYNNITDTIIELIGTYSFEGLKLVYGQWNVIFDLFRKKIERCENTGKTDQLRVKFNSPRAHWEIIFYTINSLGNELG